MPATAKHIPSFCAVCASKAHGLAIVDPTQNAPRRFCFVDEGGDGRVYKLGFARFIRDALLNSHSSSIDPRVRPAIRLRFMDSSMDDRELLARPPRLRSSSSSEFSLASSSSSNASSLPSQSSSASGSSSIDLSLFNCQFLDFPHKCLASTQLQSGVLSLASDGEFILAGTQSHGMQLLQEQSALPETLASSAASVKALLLVPGSSILLSAHQNGKIKIWKHNTVEDVPQFSRAGSLPTKRDILANMLFPGSYVRIRRHQQMLWLKHADAVSCLAASPSSGLIFSGSWDKTVKVWRSSDMKCLHSFRAHDDAVSSIVCGSNFLYTAGGDGKIKAWEVNTSSRKNRTKASLLTTLEGHKMSVNALAIDECTGHLYSASGDKTIVAWEREESASHMTRADILKGHRMAVLCLASWTSEGQGFTLLCSGSADKTVRVWRRDWKSGLHSCLTVIKGHSAPVKSLAAVLRSCSSTAYPPGSSSLHVLSGGLDSQVKHWWVSLNRDEDDQGMNCVN